MAGDQLLVVEDATEAREIAQRRQRLDREAQEPPQPDAWRHARGLHGAADGRRDRARCASSSRPTRAARRKRSPTRSAQLATAEVQVEVIHRGVGAITESDILLARASGAIIIGFHVRPDNNARAAAEREGVDIKLYRIIYEAVDDVRAALEGMLRPEEREVVLGEAEVRETLQGSARSARSPAARCAAALINRDGRRRASSATASRCTTARSRRCSASRTT